MNKKSIALLFAVSVVICPDLARSQPGPDGVMPLTTLADPYLFLVRDPYVHELIGLSKQQTASLMSLNAKADPQIWSSRGRSPQESARTTAKLTTVTKREIKKILKEQQLDRLSQIAMWTLGVRSLLREDVATSIQLSTSQLSSIQQILATSQNEKDELQKKLQSGGNATTLNKQFHEVQVRAQEQILEVLKPTQQQQWVAMLGDRIDLKKVGQVRFRAPEFSDSGKWINSPALTLDKLKGKVVALHFYAFA